MRLERNPEKLVTPVVIVPGVLRHFADKLLAGGRGPRTWLRNIRCVLGYYLLGIVQDFYVYFHPQNPAPKMLGIPLGAPLETSGNGTKSSGSIVGGGSSVGTIFPLSSR